MITHKEFAASDALFLKACEEANTKPTKRQASKFRLKRGLAYGKIGDAKSIMAREAGETEDSKG